MIMTKTNEKYRDDLLYFIMSSPQFPSTSV